MQDLRNSRMEFSLRTGSPLNLQVLVNQGNDIRIRTAELIQKRLRDVGISVKIRTIEWATFVNGVHRQRNFEAVILGWSFGPGAGSFRHLAFIKTGAKRIQFYLF